MRVQDRVVCLAVSSNIVARKVASFAVIVVKMNARVWISLIFVMLHHAVGEETEIHSLLRQIDIEENGPNVSQSEKTRLDEYRKTLIREEILRRLGLDSPPNASHIPHFPKHLIEKVLRQTAPDGEEHPQKAAQKQIITMAEAGTKSIFFFYLTPLLCFLQHSYTIVHNSIMTPT